MKCLNRRIRFRVQGGEGVLDTVCLEEQILRMEK